MNNSIKLKSGRELPLLNLKGKDYLPVAYRLVWFREEHPDWSIETEFVYQDGQSALARALIKDPLGRVMASSHKEESLKDFPVGYREKAETGAIGRALALCGYGTQFEPEFDESSRVVDSPLGGSRVVPEQPGPDDGIQAAPAPNMFTFGSWNKKSFEQIYREFGADEMNQRIEFWESPKCKMVMDQDKLGVISRCKEFLETMKISEPGDFQE